MIMKSITRALPLLFLVITACGSGDCVRSEGEAERRAVEVAPLSSIIVQGPIDVRIRRSDQQHVNIEAPANIAALLETEVVDGVWTIRTRQCYSTRKDFIVHLDVPTIRGIAIHGSGDVSSSDIFDTDELVLEVAGSGDLKVAANARTISASIAGSGDLEIKGRCERIETSIKGSGDIDASGVQAAQGTALVVGSGDIRLHVTDALEASVTGSGNIRYKGSPPNVKRNVTGSGDISER
jgi:hypothetical protein